MTEYDAAVLWMKARGFTLDRVQRWRHCDGSCIHDQHIIMDMKLAALTREQHLPTRADIIDMLRQVTGLAETATLLEQEKIILRRARKMVDSFKLPAR